MAAIVVVIFHAHPLFDVQIAPGGYLAVDLFFVLSGCVIAHAYGAKIKAGMPVVDFMALRLIRFMPFYLTGLAFGLVLFIALLIADSPNALSAPHLVLAVGLALVFVPVFWGGRHVPAQRAVVVARL